MKIAHSLNTIDLFSTETLKIPPMTTMVQTNANKPINTQVNINNTDHFKDQVTYNLHN